MVDPASGTDTRADLTGSTENFYEFWEGYRGEEILIRTNSVEVGAGGDDNARGKIEQNTFIIRGTVADITSVPPGFLLEDVEEYIKMSDLSVMFSIGVREPIDRVEGIKTVQPLREIEEKYVSFSAIEEVERADVADAATEPFRDENNEAE